MTDTPTRLDVEAALVMRETAKTRTKTIRTRAEKWIPGLAALIGLVSTALIIKGPESFSKLTGRLTIGDRYVDVKVTVAVLIGVALACLLAATYLAYAAAFGSPLSPDTINTNPIGLGARLADWRKEPRRRCAAA